MLRTYSREIKFYTNYTLFYFLLRFHNASTNEMKKRFLSNLYSAFKDCKVVYNESFLVWLITKIIYNNLFFQGYKFYLNWINLRIFT